MRTRMVAPSYRVKVEVQNTEGDWVEVAICWHNELAIQTLQIIEQKREAEVIPVQKIGEES